MSPTFRFNSDGVKAFFSMDPYHYHGVRTYCGNRVGLVGYNKPCIHCDGTCGPTNGCQCKSCYKLDLETLKRARQLGFEERFDVEFINRDNAICHVSFNAGSHSNDCDGGKYRFYCERYVGCNGYAKNCTVCDGRCGPGNGCQCAACYLLDQQCEEAGIDSTYAGYNAEEMQKNNKKRKVCDGG